MRYEEVKGLKPAAFKRLTGVRSQVFADMVAVLREAEGGWAHKQTRLRGHDVTPKT